MLTVANLAVAYDGIAALRGIDLEVQQGEMVALIGPNGAGKSTLLNALSGVVRPRSGSIGFAGQPLAGLRPHRISRMGLLQVPEGRQILADLTVEENLQLGTLALGGRPPRHDLAAVRALFPILGERRRQLAGSLSGGQQQMLAIGRALMGAPDMLLLDEPSLGLAPLICAQVFAALATLNAEGLTILLVEQNATRALASTTRAYVLEQGRIVHEGASADLAADGRIAAHYLGTEQLKLQQTEETP
jgi:branched-chain amino acid transport system ATP-binding protein